MGQKIIVIDAEELINQMSVLIDNKIAEIIPLFKPPSSKEQIETEVDFIDAKEVSEICKYSLSYVYELARTKKIPVVPTNSRTLRFIKSEIIAWLKAGRPSIIELGMKYLPNKTD